MKKIFFSIVGLWCIMCLSLRCYMNLAGFQTGRTLGKGKGEALATYNWVFNSPIFFAFDEELYDYKLREELRIPEHQFNLGAGERLDVGYKISSNRMGAFFKYSILGNDKPVALAAGFGAGFTGGNTHYLEVPLYLSFHPASYFDFYFSPGYAVVFFGGKNATYNTRRLAFTGVNTGFFLGKKLKIGMDYGLYNMGTGKRSFKFSNLGIGVKFRFGE